VPRHQLQGGLSAAPKARSWSRGDREATIFDVVYNTAALEAGASHEAEFGFIFQTNPTNTF